MAQTKLIDEKILGLAFLAAVIAVVADTLAHGFITPAQSMNYYLIKFALVLPATWASLTILKKTNAFIIAGITSLLLAGIYYLAPGTTTLDYNWIAFYIVHAAIIWLAVSLVRALKTKK